MKKVICNRAVRDPFGHRCEERKCKHRNFHKPIKGRCGVKNHNFSDSWCECPGTISPLDGQCDGELVTCMTESEIRKEETYVNKIELDNLIARKHQLQISMALDQETLKSLCKRIKILKGDK